jgi:hypothetical protein
MAIIISKHGQSAKKIHQTPPQQEDDLQRYIAANPDSLPFDDIKNNPKLLVVGREFDTDSGPIDVLALDGDGDIYIIETKLFKNPDKRLVIAQMLDYGAALTKTYVSGDGFLREIDKWMSESEAGSLRSLRQRLMTLYQCDEEKAGAIQEQIKRNLVEGDIRFVVLMDKLSERLRDLILFINQKSRFNIYAVEMEFYQHDGMEIVIPKLFGAEVKKEVASGTGGSRAKLESEEGFFAALEEVAAKPVFRKLIDFADELHARRFYGSSGISFKLPDPRGGKQGVTLFVIDRYGEVYIGWTIQQLTTLELPTTLAVEYAKSIAALFPGVKPNKSDASALDRSLKAQEVGNVLDKFKAAVTAFVQKLKQASSASKD